MNRRTSCLVFVVASTLLDFGAGVILGAEPAIRSLDVRGLKIGGTTTLTIDGDDLGKEPRLLLPFAAQQTLKPKGTEKKATFDVTLGDEVEPGYYHLRVVSEGGASLPAVVGVDRLHQQLVAEPIKSLPVAIHGTVTGSAITEVKFEGKARQRVIVEVESQRLGAKLRPIVHLHNPKKLQIAWAWGTPTIHGDARLEATLPDDGTYTVTLHDAEYAAPAPSFFRLKIGEWAYIDQVFPAVVPRDQAASVEMLGAVKVPQAGIAPRKNVEVMPLPWPKGELFSGPRPFVNVSPHAEFVETAAAGKMQEIPLGRAGVSGRLLAPFEEDRYRVAVQPGKKVRLEVFAERLGSPVDCALVVRNEQGTQLARGEDSPGTLDPVLEYTVPEKVSTIVVGVVDAQGRGGPRGVYRLVIDPQTVAAASDGFKLMTSVQRVTLAAGGQAILPVQVDRRGGFQGKIEITPAQPVPGVKWLGATIPEEADGALILLERAESPLEAVVTHLRGRISGDVDQPVVVKNHPLERLQPWLATEIAFAATTDSSKDFAIDWRDLKADTNLFPASKTLLPVKLTRPKSKTTVKLTLLTSQITPLVNNQPDPNKAIRQDKLGDLAPDVTTGDVTMLLPAELSSPVYDVTVQAELLDPAKKVLATAYAPVRRMVVILPLAVKLSGPNVIEAPFDAKKGATVKLQGKIERREGLKADVALALTGLPAGAKAEAVTVKADATDFTVNVTFPPPTPPGEIKGVKIAGSYAPDGKTPNVRVRSREVELTLVLKSPIP